jgi:hypothetical protein
MKKIRVVVGKDGSTQIRTEGFSGVECKEATKNLKKALGTVTKDSNTQEFYNESTVDQVNTNGNG